MYETNDLIMPTRNYVITRDKQIGYMHPILGKPIKIYRSQWSLKYTEIYIRWTLSYTFHTAHLSQQITKNVKVYKISAFHPE